jgi:hypothetical protein
MVASRVPSVPDEITISDEQIDHDSVLNDINHQLKKWSLQTNYLRLVHALLTISATVSSFLVASKVADQGSVIRPYISWIAFTAAVSVGLLSAFDLGSKANRVRRAWRILNVSLMRYKKGKLPIEQLLEKYFEAEEIIGDVREEPK